MNAHLSATVRLFANPKRGGAESLQARAAFGDRTLLYDAVTLAMDELLTIREQVQAVMDSAPPTAARPGSTEKVAEMRRRADRGFSLFVEGDGSLSGNGLSD